MVSRNTGGDIGDIRGEGQACEGHEGARASADALLAGQARPELSAGQVLSTVLVRVSVCKLRWPGADAGGGRVRLLRSARHRKSEK